MAAAVPDITKVFRVKRQQKRVSATGVLLIRKDEAEPQEISAYVPIARTLSYAVT